jgi:chromosome segregation ATPase
MVQKGSTVSDNSYVNKSIDKLEKAIEKIDEKCDNIDKTVALFGQRFEEHLKQDEKMYEEFKRMVDILAENTADMKHHISRTDELQDLVVALNNRLTPIEQEKLKKEAVKEFLMERAAKWGKVTGAIISVLTIAYYIVKLTQGT